MKKALILIAIIAAVVAIPLIRSQSGGQTPTVEVEALSARTISSSILASGKLAHEEEVLLSTEVIGKVSGLFVEEGDYVTAGQLVLQMIDKVRCNKRQLVWGTDRERQIEILGLVGIIGMGFQPALQQ